MNNRHTYNLAVALAAMAAANATKIYGAANIERMLKQQKRDHTKRAHTSIAIANRHTGEPHEHRRESARRLRQVGAV